jgi:hypothetical protein
LKVRELSLNKGNIKRLPEILTRSIVESRKEFKLEGEEKKGEILRAGSLYPLSNVGSCLKSLLF